MKKILSIFVALFVLAACSSEKNAEQTSQEIQNKTESNQTQTNQINQATQSEDIELSLLDGTNLLLKKGKNGFFVDEKKATMLVFFATWCPPCKAEIPQLNSLSQKFKKELNIIGVLLERKKLEEVKEFAEAYRVDYKISVGDNNYKLERAIGGVIGMPFSVLYKPNGEHAATYTGLVFEEMLQSDIIKALK